MLIVTKLHKLLFIALCAGFIFYGCNKNKEESDGWKNCTECTTESWVGGYSGTGDYKNFNNNAEAKDAQIMINIEETATDYLTVYLQSPSLFTATVSGDFSSAYIISFAGTSSSISGTMFIKDGQLKLTGNSKKFHYKADSLIVDEIITFETIKNQ